MDIVLDIRKSVQENANTYFEKSKKYKKKMLGALKTVEEARLRIEKEMHKETQSHKQLLEKKWYEKFRWFISSENLLVVGGRDATTNEIIIKKHTEPNDLVLHTQMSGSPFFVIKSKGKKIGNSSIQEAAVATVAFSRAWRLGLTTAEAFYVNPSQVSKTPNPGEYIQKGSFMIRGKTPTITAELNLAIGLTNEGRIMCAAKSAVTANCSKSLDLSQGKDKPSDIAKKIVKKLNPAYSIDDIIRILPSGTMKLT